MPVPALYRKLGRRLRPFWRTLLLASIGFIFVWFALALAAVGMGIEISQQTYERVLVYPMWLVPVLWWFLGVAIYFGWPLRARGNAGAVGTLYLQAFSWFAAMFLNVWLLILFLGPPLLWGGVWAEPLRTWFRILGPP